VWIRNLNIPFSVLKRLSNGKLNVDDKLLIDAFEG
jgi:hypothetical protein